MLARVKSAFRLLLLAVLILGGASVSFIYWANFSEGTRSGRLIKMSRRGILFKTHEGQLDVGGLRSAPGGSGTGLTSLWDFSVEGGDAKLIGALEQYQGRPVKLHYKEKYYRFFWRGDTKYFVVRVDALQ